MIFLKYTEGFGSRKKRFGAGFYTVIACCLLLIGASAWFALSKIENTQPSTVPDTSSKTEEYQDNTSSYIETVPEEPIKSTPAEDVKKDVSSEPYTSSESHKEETDTSYAFIMPVEGEVIKDYSENSLQYSSTYGDMRIHNGIDISCNSDSPIFSCGDGTVKGIENSSENGTVVIIEHKNSITIKYASLKELKVKQGDKVKMGDTIGISTTVPSECNDKSHIHIEAYKDGKQVSPLKALGLD